MSLLKLYTKLFISAAKLSIIKSVYYRLRFFHSLKKPIFVGYGTSIMKDKDALIKVQGNLHIDSKNDGQFWYYSNLRLKKNSQLTILGNVNIFSGMSLKLFEGAKLTINSGTYFSGPITIHCIKEIIIGENCSIAWNCTILDSNFHQVDSNKPIKTEKIIIGNNVWIGNNVVILPGTIINDNVIIGAGSIVKGNLVEDGIYIGNPLVFVKKRN